MARGNFDEVSRRSVPMKDYFDAMKLTEEQINNRITLGEKIKDLLTFVFELIDTYAEYEDMGYALEYAFVKSLLSERFRQIVSQYTRDNAFVANYSVQFSEQIVEVTIRHRGEEYYTSEDRAELIAENEAGTIMNHEEFIENLAQGKMRKMWISSGDSHTRHSHMEMDGETIDITEPFIVNGSQMMYPRDTSLGADGDEIVNCRCCIEYME